MSPTLILGVDPGQHSSGAVWYEAHAWHLNHHHRRVDTWRPPGVLKHSENAMDNGVLLSILRGPTPPPWTARPDLVVVEDVVSYGMAVGESTFATREMVGRIRECCQWVGIPFWRISRPEVGRLLCHTNKATTANLRRRIMDIHGGDNAKGRKADPGPLYGLAGNHALHALAVVMGWRLRDMGER